MNIIDRYDGFYVSYVPPGRADPRAMAIDLMLATMGEPTSGKNGDETALVVDNNFFIMDGDQRGRFNSSMTARDAVLTVRDLIAAGDVDALPGEDPQGWLMNYTARH